MILKTGVDKNEIVAALIQYKVLGKEKFLKGASNPEEDTQWTINTFIRNHLDFLYAQKILKPNETLPPLDTIKKGLEKYIKDNDLNLPHHKGTNRNKINLNAMYKELHEYIKTGKTLKPSSELETIYERDLEDESPEYLYNLAKERKIKLKKKLIGNEDYLLQKLGVFK